MTPRPAHLCCTCVPCPPRTTTTTPITATSGLLAYRNPKIVRHTKDRTFIIAENGEASAGAAGWCDLLIETKADPNQSHRETTNLFWYVRQETVGTSNTRSALPSPLPSFRFRGRNDPSDQDFRCHPRSFLGGRSW